MKINGEVVELPIPIVDDEDEVLLKSCMRMMYDDKKTDNFVEFLKIDTEEINKKILKEQKEMIERAGKMSFSKEESHELLNLYSKIPSMRKRLSADELLYFDSLRKEVMLRKKIVKKKDLIIQHNKTLKGLEAELKDVEKTINKLEVE